MRKYLLHYFLFLSTLAFSQEKGTSQIGITVGTISSNNLLNTIEEVIQGEVLEVVTLKTQKLNLQLQ